MINRRTPEKALLDAERNGIGARAPIGIRSTQTFQRRAPSAPTAPEGAQRQPLRIWMPKDRKP